MAFLKLFLSAVILGGGVGYTLLCIVTPKESNIVKHLPPHSSDQLSIFQRYKSQDEIFMHKKKLNISSKKNIDEARDNTKIVEK